MTPFLLAPIISSLNLSTAVSAMLTTTDHIFAAPDVRAECHPRCGYAVGLCVRGFEMSREECVGRMCGQDVVSTARGAERGGGGGG